MKTLKLVWNQSFFLCATEAKCYEQFPSGLIKMTMACASKDLCRCFPYGVGMQDKATVEQLAQCSGRRRACFPACGGVGPSWPDPASVGFAVTVHVADV